MDNVDAGSLQSTSPANVALLVKTSSHLDERNRLLALLGGDGERWHDWSVTTGAVDRVLDRQHIRVGNGLLHEAFDRGGEGFIGVMHEDVGLANLREHVDGFVVVCRQAAWYLRLPRAKTEIRATDLCQHTKATEVQGWTNRKHLSQINVERFDQHRAHIGRHRLIDLEPHDIAKAAAGELSLHGFQQVVSALLDLEVRVARDPKGAGADDFHAGEQCW